MLKRDMLQLFKAGDETHVVAPRYNLDAVRRTTDALKLFVLTMLRYHATVCITNITINSIVRDRCPK